MPGQNPKKKGKTGGKRRPEQGPPTVKEAPPGRRKLSYRPGRNGRCPMEKRRDRKKKKREGNAGGDANSAPDRGSRPPAEQTEMKARGQRFSSFARGDQEETQQSEKTVPKDRDAWRRNRSRLFGHAQEKEHSARRERDGEKESRIKRIMGGIGLGENRWCESSLSPRILCQWSVKQQKNYSQRGSRNRS